LDSRQRLAPIGVAGEIYLGGEGIARGYLNQPVLTSERFIADPFSNDGFARLYRTGDLGRWRDDGMIEYVGRIDGQVKIRGYRIELGEVEAQIRTKSRVNEVAVLASQLDANDIRLVAYVVPRDRTNDNERLSVEELRASLKDVLPEYMIPSAWVILKEMPLTSNGKLDRGALPAPMASASTSRPYEPPDGLVEEALSEIWRELLRCERVGRSESFLDLGGHSLLAMRLVGRVRDEFGFELPLRSVFDNLTIKDLARIVVPN